MKFNNKTFSKQFDKMPIYGELRELDKRLTFGQYLTVLKEWWDKTKKEKEGFEAELREIEGIWKTYFGKDADAMVPTKEILGE